MSDAANNIYVDGTYLANNPTWHEEDSPFKAKHIFRLLNKNPVNFSSIAEIGCGVGGVLRNLRKLTRRVDAKWEGFDISDIAIGIARENLDNEGILFRNEDLLALTETFDVLLIVDVFEHVPDYLGFVSSCRQKAKYKIYHIPLDLSVWAALFDNFHRPRRTAGHLHYFNESTAKATLIDTGHTIIDAAFTPSLLELYPMNPTNLPRFVIDRLSPSLSSRLMGGYSLLVLAE